MEPGIDPTDRENINVEIPLDLNVEAINDAVLHAVQLVVQHYGENNCDCAAFSALLQESPGQYTRARILRHVFNASEQEAGIMFVETVIYQQVPDLIAAAVIRGDRLYTWLQVAGEDGVVKGSSNSADLRAILEQNENGTEAVLDSMRSDEPPFLLRAWAAPCLSLPRISFIADIAPMLIEILEGVTAPINKHMGLGVPVDEALRKLTNTAFGFGEKRRLEYVIAATEKEIAVISDSDDSIGMLGPVPANNIDSAVGQLCGHGCDVIVYLIGVYPPNAEELALLSIGERPFNDDITRGISSSGAYAITAMVAEWERVTGRVAIRGFWSATFGDDGVFGKWVQSSDAKPTTYGKITAAETGEA